MAESKEYCKQIVIVVVLSDFSLSDLSIVTVAGQLLRKQLTDRFTWIIPGTNRNFLGHSGFHTFILVGPCTFRNIIPSNHPTSLPTRVGFAGSPNTWAVSPHLDLISAVWWLVMTGLGWPPTLPGSRFWWRQRDNLTIYLSYWAQQFGCRGGRHSRKFSFYRWADYVGG